jgi:PleD family two-component response regulator
LLAAALQKRESFERPSLEGVRMALARDAGELEDVLSLCAAGAKPQTVSGTPVAWAVHAALSLLEITGTATPNHEVAAKTLTTLRERAALTPEALEALASVLSDTLLRRSAGAPVVVLFEEGLTSAAIHSRLLAEGVRALAARTAADVERYVAEGAGALVVSSRAPGVDVLELTKGLRASTQTARLPVFMVVPPNQSDLLEEGLEAGADVMEHPVNVDVLTAKLRRATSRYFDSTANTIQRSVP